MKLAIGSESPAKPSEVARAVMEWEAFPVRHGRSIPGEAMDLSPNRQEMKWIGAFFAWALLAGPAVMLGAVALRLDPGWAPWIVGLWGSGLLLILAVLLGMYGARIAREMGAGGLVVVLIRTGAVILLSGVLYAMARALFLPVRPPSG